MEEKFTAKKMAEDFLWNNILPTLNGVIVVKQVPPPLPNIEFPKSEKILERWEKFHKKTPESN